MYGELVGDLIKIRMTFLLHFLDTGITLTYFRKNEEN